MLYYDTILSNDGRACASCHVQQKGFTSDFFAYNMPVLPHVNLAWNSNFMWDGSKQGKLEDVMLFEVKVFFGTDLAKLNSNPKYRSLFKKYFGVAEITYKELSYALAQFVRTMNSGNSKYDRYLLGNEELSYDEMQGRNLFFTEKGDCYHCHLNPVLTDNQLHNTGLDSLYAKEADKGFYNVSLDKKDLGKFKTPSLRNVALRSRFMHDGRFSTLDEVIEFYNSGVRKVENLDPIMTKPGKENGLKLTAWEKRPLIIFLQTFTDSAFISSPALSRP
jgi:cytochrome c peroxidase